MIKSTKYKRAILFTENVLIPWLIPFSIFLVRSFFFSLKKSLQIDNFPPMWIYRDGLGHGPWLKQVEIRSWACGIWNEGSSFVILPIKFILNFLGHFHLLRKPNRLTFNSKLNLLMLPINEFSFQNKVVQVLLVQSILQISFDNL